MVAQLVERAFHMRPVGSSNLPHGTFSRATMLLVVAPAVVCRDFLVP